uniref:Uncharacterized protein n=1 Tax=Arundo donax TaxID=35708 RepID=A0A0A9FE06_ARUDO
MNKMTQHNILNQPTVPDPWISELQIPGSKKFIDFLDPELCQTRPELCPPCLLSVVH